MIRVANRRSGFTLVELLVSMALAVVILALAVGISQSSAFESYKITGAADRISQWMIVAKNRALRENRPVGIRLIPDATNANLYKEIAYIEQPEAIPSTGNLLAGTQLNFYYPARITQTSPTMAQPSGTFNISYTGPFPAGGMGAPLAPSDKSVFLTNVSAAVRAELLTTLQPGDLISVPELNAVLRLGNPAITATDPPGAPGLAATQPPHVLQLNVSATDMPEVPQTVYSVHASSTRDGNPHPSIPSSPINGTLTVSNFSIQRAPRTLLGEPTQQLPVGMAIDCNTGVGLNTPPLKTGNIRDILFSPSGEVIGASRSITALVVRDTALPNVTAPLTTDYNNAGQLILICVYNRTGAIATQPVNPPPATDPYKFAKDGINTGL